jgi:hypothetical protein
MRTYSWRRGLMSLEQLEGRLSLSSLPAAQVLPGAVHTVPVIVRSLDDDPPPGPEPAPPANPVDGPIQYPTLPPSGPLGPG